MKHPIQFIFATLLVSTMAVYAQFERLTCATAESFAARLDLRDGFGGRVVQGVVALSTEEGAVKCDGKVVGVSWDTAKLSDGWHTLSCNGKTERVCVRNDATIRLEEGRLMDRVTWDNDVVHVVRNDVYVPNGVTLSISEGAIVKFAEDSRIIVEHGGKIAVNGGENLPIEFAQVADDSVGGDTDLQDAEVVNETDPRIKCYKDDGWLDNSWFVVNHVVVSVLPYLVVQPVRAMRQGGIVRIPVTVSGTRSDSFAVDWQTVDGTAKYGVDFTENSGRVNWSSTSAGVRYIEIPLVAESQTDEDVTFTVRLVRSYGANIQTAEAVITIYNNAGSEFDHLTAATSTSQPVRLDLRDDFGGRIAQGVMAMSNTDGDVTLNGKVIGESWDTTKLADGWVELSQGGETRDVAVLNTDDVHCEEGRLTENTTWDNSAVRLIRNDVYIPNGVTLIINAGTTVKFTEDTRIIVENGGKLQMNGTEDAFVQFSMATDDGYAGDTDMREAEVVFPTNALIFNYSSGTVADNGYVASRGLVISTTYPSLTLHGVAVYEDCSMVYLPVTVSSSRNSAFYAEWTATDGTATFDEDYGLASGKLTWNSTNDGTKYIEIPVMAGHLAADEETFTVRLVASGGANIQTTAVTVTIRKMADAGMERLVHATVVSDAARLDLRDGFGGRIVRGTIDLSTTEGKVSLNGKDLSSPWKSTTSKDGWYELAQNGQMAEICVLNNNNVALEEGRLTQNTTWDDSLVHLIRNDVYVPNGVTLTMTSGVVVKFTEDTRIIVEHGGKISVQGAEDSPVQFALATDDTYGGDTDWRDGEMDVPSNSLIYCYKNDTGWTDNGNLVSRQVAFNTLPTVSIHNSRVMEHEGVVMIPVTVSGTRKASFAVDWKAIDGTAKLNNDYTLSSGRVSWTSTDNGTRYIEIPIISDATEEDLEDFTVVLTASSGTNIATTESTVSIVESAATLPADAEYACGSGESFDSVELDERTDLFSRLAHDVESIRYSTNWYGRSSAAQAKITIQLEEIGEHTETLFASLPDETEGMVNWETNGFQTGVYLLAHETLDKRGALLERLETNFFINRKVIAHAGRIEGNEIWDDSYIHVIQADVIVPAGVELTITSKAIVKFQEGCSLIIKLGGVVNATGVTFTHIADDSVGGDTNLDGNVTMATYDAYSIGGDGAAHFDASCKFLFKSGELPSGTLRQNLTLLGNLVYKSTGSLTIANGYTLTIQPGAILKFNSGHSLVISSGATLNALGSRALPIVFTSIKDDTHGGDTNRDGTGSEPQAGDWKQLVLSGTAEMNYCSIMYPEGANNQGGVYNTGNLEFHNGEIAHSVYDCLRSSGNANITNSVLQDSTIGFAPSGGNNLMVNCVMYDVSTGVRWPNGTFVNCIFARMSEFVDTSFGTGMTFKNCLFWNDPSFGPQECYAVGENGNIWGDPLFTDAENSNFQLRAGSPCIDAGDGSIADLPPCDYYGNPRWNDEHVIPTGIPDEDGNYPDIGIFELCGVVDSNLDLIVNWVKGPTVAMSGEFVTVRWMVSNLGTVSGIGARRDSIYLVSMDERLGSRRVLLDYFVSDIPLVSNGSCEYETIVQIPAVTPGNWTFAVFANEQRDWFEGKNAENNYTISTRLCNISVPSVNVQGNESLIVESGTSMALQLSGLSANGTFLVIHGGGALNITGASGHVPETFTGGWQTIKLESGVALLQIPPLPEGQEAFLLLENEGSEDVQIELEAVNKSFALYDNGKMTVAFPKWNISGKTNVTIPLYGIGLSEDMEVYLAQGDKRVDATSVTAAIDGAFYAVFNIRVTSTSIGNWTLYASNENGSDSLEALSIVSSSRGAQWYCHLEIPSAIRKGRPFIGTFVYGNSGDLDMSAPYVTITSDVGVNMRLSENDSWGKSVEFLALSEHYPVSRLKAGEERRQSFQFMQLNDNSDVQFNYVYIDKGVYTYKPPLASASTRGALRSWYNYEDYWDETHWDIYHDQSYTPTPAPWSISASSLRPDWTTDAQWNTILRRLRTAVGNTWNSYFNRLRANADYLALLGQGTNDLGVLWQLDAREALAVDNAVSTLATSTDLVRSGRGYDIVISRTYGTSLQTRSTDGIFGMGWIVPYQLRAVLKDNGEALELQLPSGGSYDFEKSNGVWISTIPRDKNQLSENDSEFILAFRDGSMVRFDKGNGLLNSIRDCNNNGLDFSYADEKLNQITHTDGQFVKLTYNGSYVVKAEDDQGHIVTYQYTGDKLTAVTDVNGLVTLYDANMTKITFPDGNTLDYTFDEMGRVATISRNGNQQTITIERGKFGCYSVIETDGAVTDTVVGASGEILYRVDALGNKTVCKYDNDVAAITTIQTATGRKAHFDYDKDFCITRYIAPDGTVTHLSYSMDFGELACYTDAKGQSVYYSYDDNGHGIRNIMADGKGGALEYNAKGDIVSVTDRSGRINTMEYDSYGRLLVVRDADGQSQELVYNAKGNVVKLKDSLRGDTTMSYTEQEQLKSIQYTDGRGFTYEYDSYGRIVKQTYSDSFAQCYEYDALGRISRMTDNIGNLLVSLEYDIVTGMLVTKVFGNGTSVHYTYDLNGNLLSITHKDKNGNDLERFQYTYDEDGRRTQVESFEGVETYTYDLVGQLTGVTYPDGSTEMFNYDAVGNRVSANGEAYTVNELNQYLTAGDATFTYDDNGNMASRTDANGTTTYEYDVNSRLVRVIRPDGTEWNCQYDSLGNRTLVNDNGQIRKQLHTFGSLPSLAAEYNASGKLIRRYILLGSTLIADIDALGNYRYYHDDALGSTRLMTNGVGTIVSRQSYNAFGGLRVASGEAIRFGFVGMYGVEVDATGLLFMRNRYYDTAIGRFRQMDPIGINAGDVNWYRYCANNPILFIDKLGYYSENCPNRGHGNKARGFVHGALIGGSMVGGASTSGYSNYWQKAKTQFYTYGSSYNQHYGSYNKMHIKRANRIGKFFAWLDLGIASYDIGEGIAEGGIEEGARRAYTTAGSWAAAVAGAKAGAIALSWAGPWGAAIGAIGGAIGGGFLGGKILGWFGETVLPPPNCGNPPPGGENGNKRTTSPKSCDPNEMVGPVGFGNETMERFVTPDEWLSYTINFENKSSSTAAAQEVFVDAQLSEYLDWSTFEIGSVLFSNQLETGLMGKQRGKILVDRQNTNQKVQIEVTMDAKTGKVRWHLRSYDPNTTDHWPSDVYDGFLPPNDDNHIGEGSLTYRIKVKEDAPHNARIDAAAEIVFDANAMIPTDPAWFNTVYAMAPTDDFEPSLPDGTVLLQLDSLSWRTVAGAAEYDVTLWKVVDGHDVQVASAIGLKMGYWNIAEYMAEEVAGTTYHWQITARNGLGSKTSDVYSLRTLREGEVIDYALRSGWNLISVPFEIDTATGGDALLSMSPFIYDRLVKAYTRVTESMKAGTAAWLFSRETKSIRIWTDKGAEVEPKLPPDLQTGWNLTGICGIKELILDCDAESVSAIWTWSGGKFVSVPIENGAALLEPGIGYWIYLDK